MKEDMKIRLDYNNVMAEYVGTYGITEDLSEAYGDKIKKAISVMKEKNAKGEMGFRKLPFNQDAVVSEIEAYVEEVKDKYDAFVILGIGGSALGPIAVQQAINHPYYNEISREKRKGFPKFYVLDNVDPERIPAFLEAVDIKKCLFNVISKSGSTSETMSQYMIIEKMLEEEVGYENLKNHFVFTTDKEKGNLIKIGSEKGYKMFVVPEEVGGRFSELTPVGLLGAAMCGIDIREMLAGAAAMERRCETDDVRENPAYMYAILHYLLMESGINMSVMMPYADSLKFMSDWYAQLWAESIGKKFNNDGEKVFAGQTPVKALGVTDQHSQVQLYTEGPFDKVIVLLGTDKYKRKLTIPKIYEDIQSIGFLGGHTQNELISIEQKATEYALTKSNKPNMTITLPEVNEYTIGQLIQMFELATAFMGELMEINAFDQPGVEEGKNATYAMFDKPGYEEKKAELMSVEPKKDDYKI